MHFSCGLPFPILVKQCKFLYMFAHFRNLLLLFSNFNRFIKSAVKPRKLDFLQPVQLKFCSKSFFWPMPYNSIAIALHYFSCQDFCFSLKVNRSDSSAQFYDMWIHRKSSHFSSRVSLTLVYGHLFFNFITFYFNQNLPTCR